MTMHRVTRPPQPKRRRNTRSARRLGTDNTVLENRVSSSATLNPAITFWNVNRVRLAGVAVLLLCGWMIYFLFAGESFYVYGAGIEGNHILSDQEIYNVANIHTQSVFWINPRTVEATIESEPNIKTAQVRISLPANVTITVEERQPEVVWKTGDMLWWIDNEGMVVPPRDGIDEAETRLRIIDPDATPLTEGEQLDLTIVRGAQIVHHHIPDVVELYHTANLGLIYLSAEGWPVYLGKSVDIPTKIQVANAMRGDLLARGVTPRFIDVRNPNRGVYQPADNSTGL